MARLEDTIQEGIVAYLKLALPKVLVFAIPNEAKRSFRLAGALKRRGMLPGIPDLCLVTAGGNAHFLEVKSAKGRHSEAQDEIATLMTLRFIPRATVRSILETETALKAWGLL